MTECWLGPDLNADLVPLVEHPEQWAASREACAMLQLYSQQTGAEFENEYDVGPNYHARLVERGFYRKLRELGVPLGFETAGIKDWSPDGGQAAWSLQHTFNRVRAAGGDVANFSLDDPLAAAQKDIHPALSMDQAVAAVVRVFEVGEANGVRGGITEAFPLVSAADIVHFIERLQQAGHGPTHLHLDIDEQYLRQTMTNAQIQSDLRWLQRQCRAWTQGSAVCRFGVIINGQRGDSPEAYRAGLQEWFAFARRMLDGDADRYILQSWKKKNLPANLPESDPLSATGLLLEVSRALPFQAENQP